MTRKQIPFFAVLCLLLNVIFISYTYSEEKKIIFGGKNGWNEIIQRNQITTGKGLYGYECLEIIDSALDVTSNTDLLLSFEELSENLIVDKSGHYDVIISNAQASKKHIRGKKSAQFTNGLGGLRLEGKKQSIFGTEGIVNSFSIEYWLCPLVVESGENVLRWRSSRNLLDTSLYQMIDVGIWNNKLRWNFFNVFDNSTSQGTQYSLLGVTSLIPGKWSHHVISYDEVTGLLEYRMNGRIEAVEYVTSSGHESGEVYLPILGVPADLEICSSYSGLIDDFCILREPYNYDRTFATYNTYGRFITESFCPSEKGSSLTGIDITATIPPETATGYFIRSALDNFDWTDTYPEWKPIKGNDVLDDIKGKFFQIAVDLYPDGGGQRTPSITELVVRYEEREPPLPPYRLSAKALDGAVLLEWTASVVGEREDSAGYYVYYGGKPGEYMEINAEQGRSPVDVGNTTSIKLTGLENGKIYYFVVSAYSGEDLRIEGELTQEVNARPMSGQ